MLMILGLFPFEIGTAAFQDLSRKRDWRHAETPRFGAAPASQYLGPGSETVSLSGLILPGVSGEHWALRVLTQMAKTGEAHKMVDATGRVHGDYVILGIDEKHSVFMDNGVARKADFTIELRRVGE